MAIEPCCAGFKSAGKFYKATSSASLERFSDYSHNRSTLAIATSKAANCAASFKAHRAGGHGGRISSTSVLPRMPWKTDIQRENAINYIQYNF